MIKKDKTQFNPPEENHISTFIDAVKEDIEKEVPQKTKSNLTKREQKALLRLKQNKSIIIKNADKGGAIVIQDVQKYKDEALRQLNNEQFYKKLKHDKTEEHAKKISAVLKQLGNRNEIPKEMVKDLNVMKPRTPVFYTQPKIHKENNPGRPVISSSGCHTEKLSAYVDEIIKPIAQKLPSYIQDTTDFIKSIKKKRRAPPKSYLVTMDVSSLYTNIDNDEGLKTLKEILDKERGQNKIPTNNAIVTLMKLVLTLNNFEFDEKHYLQIKGTAMGTRAAPNYANIYMGKFEKMNIYETTYIDLIEFFKRFIDDIFFIWISTEENLKKFFEYINSVHPSIKFTFEYSQTEINFLDVTVRKDKDGMLSTDLYRKAVDTHSYLNRKSCHPEHTKASIPYSQFMRARRICSNDQEFKKRIIEQRYHFENCGYNKKGLDKIIRDVIDKSQEDALKKNDKEKRDITTSLITTFNPKVPPLKETIKKHWHITQSKEIGRKALTTEPAIVYRRAKNLKDHLVKSKFRSNNNIQQTRHNGFNPCNSVLCSWCSKIESTDKFQSTTTRKEYKILHNLKCNSPYVIYLIQCKKCQKQYVGKTKPALNIRMNNHRSHKEQGNIMYGITSLCGQQKM